MSESNPLVAGIACRQLAINEGADDQTSQLALALGYMQGLTPVSLITSVVLARRDAETRVGNGVSNGSARVAVPALAAGTTVADATAAITAAGLTVSTSSIREPNATVPAELVIRTQPAAGTPVARGSAVVLVISSGPPPPPSPNG